MFNRKHPERFKSSINKQFVASAAIPINDCHDSNLAPFVKAINLGSESRKIDLQLNFFSTGQPLDKDETPISETAFANEISIEVNP
jgi:hypothetical protein